MTRSEFLILLLLATISINASACVAAPVDKRLVFISSGQLKHLINSTPIDSPEQLTLITRASRSDFLEEAYQQYSLLWHKSPGSLYVNLLRGVAAEYYWLYMGPYKMDSNFPVDQANELQQVAKSCLTKAIHMQPNSPLVNKQYGYFLYRLGGDTEAGKKHLEMSLSLRPSDPVTHMFLGEIYANPTTKLYAPETAARLFHEAATLDVRYAFPHFLLADLYIRVSRYQEAQTELSQYLALAPADFPQRSEVQRLQSQINAGLNRR